MHDHDSAHGASGGPARTEIAVTFRAVRGGLVGLRRVQVTATAMGSGPGDMAGPRLGGHGREGTPN
eukprot:11166278-Alexandrium_andersonii.AAC.1